MCVKNWFSYFILGVAFDKGSLHQLPMFSIPRINFFGVYGGDVLVIFFEGQSQIVEHDGSGFGVTVAVDDDFPKAHFFCGDEFWAFNQDGAWQSGPPVWAAFTFAPDLVYFGTGQGSGACQGLLNFLFGSFSVPVFGVFGEECVW